MPESHAKLGRQGYLSCQSWTKYDTPPPCNASTATWPFFVFTSQTVTSANSLFEVMATAVGIFSGGNFHVALLVPDAVAVPAMSTSPDEKMITPQFAQVPMARAMA